MSSVPSAQTRPNSLPLSLGRTDSLSLARQMGTGLGTLDQVSPEQKGGDAAGCGLGVWALKPAEWRIDTHHGLLVWGESDCKV